MSSELEKFDNQDRILEKINQDDFHTNSLIQRHRTFLQRLFPSQLQQTVDLFELSQARTELEFRDKTLNMVKTAQLQCISETFNDFLEKSKAQSRRDRAEFILRQRNRLQDTVNYECEKFTQNIARELERVDRISIPVLKNREQDRVFAMIDSFHRTVEILIKDFENILREKISPR